MKEIMDEMNWDKAAEGGKKSGLDSIAADLKKYCSENGCEWGMGIKELSGLGDGTVEYDTEQNQSTDESLPKAQEDKTSKKALIIATMKKKVGEGM